MLGISQTLVGETAWVSRPQIWFTLFIILSAPIVWAGWVICCLCHSSPALFQGLRNHLTQPVQFSNLVRLSQALVKFLLFISCCWKPKKTAWYHLGLYNWILARTSPSPAFLTEFCPWCSSWKCQELYWESFMWNVHLSVCLFAIIYPSDV